MTAMTTDRTSPRTPTRRAPGRLVADAVALGYGERTVVDGLSFVVPDGAVTAVVGANACGKSTLLRGMARLLRPTLGRGAARRRGDPPAAHPAGRPDARSAAAGPVAPEGVSVVDLVSRGRHPHQGACVAGPARTTPPSPRLWR